MTSLDPAASASSDSEPGLSQAEATARLAQYGPNRLPVAKPPHLALIFVRQFLSPLIYILIAAAALSFALGDVQDGLFIAVVLLINGMVGTVQEHSAGAAAAALRNLEQPVARVVRDGTPSSLPSEQLVPGDLVLLEAGGRVPADLELVEASDLRCDESLLTGESVPVRKVAAETAADDRQGRVFAGTSIVRGRGCGVVVATGAATQIGRIAGSLAANSASKAPLQIRMEHLARSIAIAVAVAIALLVTVGFWRGMESKELFMLSVGLAVSAIPEGLPVAISVALAIAMRRMAKFGVIVRSMTAVEALGSCTLIATDKTGTLTLNELTVTDLTLPDGTTLTCEPGKVGEGLAFPAEGEEGRDLQRRIRHLLVAATLPNEATLARVGDDWVGNGDTVDVALLALAKQAGVLHDETRRDHPLLGRIPYEPDRRYAASFHQTGQGARVFVKGAPETLIDMCGQMDLGEAVVPIDRAALLGQKQRMAESGLRVLGFAVGEIASDRPDGYDHGALENLTFLGMAGMQDPVRPEVPEAIERCRRAGIELAMITGDDPATARNIAERAGLAVGADAVVSGDDVRRAAEQGEAALDRLTSTGRIFARVSPDQKLAIVLSLARNGHFVAVTGDGVNDAPALRHAHVGVAMGRRGTDVAKESADLVLTDDNFASIVSGIREGRVAYANIRKVVLMLVSTGAAEVVLFLLAIPLGLPMPLLPVQLLWLNLVTNGIQDVALATEHAEGDELDQPPRRPREPIFDRLMVRRIVLSTIVMAGGGLLLFWLLLQAGYAVESARNLLLMLFVLFENAQVLNSRSERRSAFRQSFLSNPFVIVAVIAAQALHLLAMYLPGLSDTLAIGPVSPLEWSMLALVAAGLVLVVELDKWLAGRTGSAGRRQASPR